MIRDVYSGSQISRIRNLGMFNQSNCYEALWNVIRDVYSWSRIQGSKKRWISDPQHCRGEIWNTHCSTIRYLWYGTGSGSIKDPSLCVTGGNTYVQYLFARFNFLYRNFFPPVKTLKVPWSSNATFWLNGTDWIWDLGGGGGVWEVTAAFSFFPLPRLICPWTVVSSGNKTAAISCCRTLIHDSQLLAFTQLGKESATDRTLIFKCSQLWSTYTVHILTVLESKSGWIHLCDLKICIFYAISYIKPAKFLL